MHGSGLEPSLAQQRRAQQGGFDVWHERPEPTVKARAVSAVGFAPATWSMYV
jgi:hypothetical protein